MSDDDIRALRTAADMQGLSAEFAELLAAVQDAAAYARAAVAAAYEHAAQLCEAEAALWKGEQDISDFKLCAARIRAAIRREPT